MEQLGLDYLLKLIKEFGLPGMIFLVWWLDQKSQRTMLRAYREDTTLILKKYKEDMENQRQMYESNAALVKSYEGLAGSLKDVVILNTQAITRQCDLIANNQYCPNVRLRKESPGVIS